MGTRSSKRQRKEGIAPAAEAPSQASGKRSQAAAAAPSAPAPGAPKRPAGKRKPAAPKSKVRQQTITINRAPVLTLWAAVVAQREGMSWDAALTVGRWVSGTLAHSKGRSLGVFAEHERSEEEVEARRRRDEEQGVQRVQAFGMKVPAVLVGGERRAVSGGSPISPASVQSYLKRAFKEDLTAAKEAMEELAGAIPPAEIGGVAYTLYEELRRLGRTRRPEWKGWGAKGSLHLRKIRGLARTWRRER